MDLYVQEINIDSGGPRQLCKTKACTKSLNSEFHKLAFIHCYYHQLLKSRSWIILSLWNTVQCTMALLSALFSSRKWQDSFYLRLGVKNCVVVSRMVRNFRRQAECTHALGVFRSRGSCFPG